jgi:hypothetical protein
MGLDLKALASGGIATAKSLVPDAFVKCLVKLGPTSSTDPVEETTSTVWDVETVATLLGYDDSDERKNLPVEEKQRTFLLDAGDYPPGSPFRQTGEITTLDAADQPVEKWNVYRAEVPPGAAIAIFYCRR